MKKWMLRLRPLWIALLVLCLLYGAVYAVESYIIHSHVTVITGEGIAVYGSQNMLPEDIVTELDFGTVKRGGSSENISLWVMNLTDKYLKVTVTASGNISYWEQPPIFLPGGGWAETVIHYEAAPNSTLGVRNFDLEFIPEVITTP